MIEILPSGYIILSLLKEKKKQLRELQVVKLKLSQLHVSNKEGDLLCCQTDS